MSALIVINNRVANLLAHPERWTKQTLARDKNGRAVWFLGEEACCWCLSGAISKCYPNVEDRNRVRKMVEREVGYILGWNDTFERTHEEVHSLCVRLGI